MLNAKLFDVRWKNADANLAEKKETFEKAIIDMELECEEDNLAEET